MARSGLLRLLKTIVLSPLYTLQIFSTAKSFRKNPILGNERLNRRGLHIWRVKLAAKIAASRRRKLQHLVPEEERNFFAENGYIERRNLLPEAAFRKLVAEIDALEAPALEMKEGTAVTRRMPLWPGILGNSPTIRALLDDSSWLNAVRYVGGFNSEPLVSVQTIFGTPSVHLDKKDPQTNLHMDTFHPTVKAWYFLHDVPEDEGPFTYVAGSHKLTRRRLAWQKRMSISAARAKAGGAFRISRSMLKRLHLPPPTAFAVPANTLIIGDTFGFHARGYSARPSIRVEIYTSQRLNPFLPFVGPDLARLPFVRGCKQTLAWHVENLATRLGLYHSPMRLIGKVRPRQPRT